jgi:SulP family sulfate permease
MSKVIYIRQWLPNYESGWLSADLLSGISVWAVLAPTAMAYSSLVGVSPIIGLYCIPLGLLAYAIFGSSRLMVVGPDATIAVLSGTVIAGFAITSAATLPLAIGLALVVGLLYILFYLLRLGWISDVIPLPVLKGVVEGIVWVTILKELTHLFGIHLSGENSRFFPKLFELVGSLSEAHPIVVLVGVGSLISLFLAKWFFPRLPGAFLILTGALGASYFFGFDDLGVETLGKAEGGAMSASILAGFDPFILLNMLPGATAIVILGFALTIAAAKRAAEKTGESIDPDQELLALGAANVGVSVSGGFPIVGSLSKTGVAIESGGKSQIGNLVASVLTILTILYLLPYLSPLPHATLAAVVIMVMLEVSDLRYFKELRRVQRKEFIMAIVAIGGVFAYGALIGVVLGVGLGLILLADHISRPPVSIVGRNDIGEYLPLDGATNVSEIPGLMIWRQYAPLVFLNARRLSSSVKEHLTLKSDIRVVLIDAVATSGIDSTGIAEFEKLRDYLANENIELWVANIRDLPWSRIVSAEANSGKSNPPRFVSLIDATLTFEQGDAPY